MENVELLQGTVTMRDGSQVTYDGLPQTQFKLIFEKAPLTVFFLQEFSVPAVEVTVVDRKTRYLDLGEIGEKLKFGDFRVTFMVDRDMRNFKEIFSWMKRMTASGGSLIDDADNPILLINNKPYIRFWNAWPMMLSNLQFKSNATDLDYIVADALFNIDYYEFIDDPLLGDETK